MKNNIVRLFVLSLTVAGFASASVVSHARSNKAEVAPVGVFGSHALCNPNNGSECGMD